MRLFQSVVCEGGEVFAAVQRGYIYADGGVEQVGGKTVFACSKFPVSCRVMLR